MNLAQASFGVMMLAAGLQATAVALLFRQTGYMRRAEQRAVAQAVKASCAPMEDSRATSIIPQVTDAGIAGIAERINHHPAAYR
jgi:hypothetical protein